ncbi:hypothetical protein TEA_023422 [Camellia sinensis var. sinensis]|uniref:Uncharacterized protein n=1 Tax=Camellia sinensis var. sinensis TaxID=542762 RepID=A0A4S4CWP6_CAMSN|nr:hypothetical protein TEA_023422 [Camellia sinensis var. sinensis]
MMTQPISSSGVEWCDRWNGGRSSRVEWIFKLITETERSIYLWPYILDWCMLYELEQPAETENWYYTVLYITVGIVVVVTLFKLLIQISGSTVANPERNCDISSLFLCMYISSINVLLQDGVNILAVNCGSPSACPYPWPLKLATAVNTSPRGKKLTQLANSRVWNWFQGYPTGGLYLLNKFEMSLQPKEKTHNHFFTFMLPRGFTGLWTQLNKGSSADTPLEEEIAR